MIWDDVIIPFAKYGFNKSHAIAYSVLGYKTAYYKAHANIFFMTSLLNSKTKDKDKEKIAEIKKEMKSSGYKILPASISHSKAFYSVLTKDSIVMGLGAIEGVGEKLIENIISAQPFSSVQDFIRRVSPNKKVFANLVKAGALDEFKFTRKFLLENYEQVDKYFDESIKNYKKALKASSKKTMSLFDSSPIVPMKEKSDAEIIEESCASFVFKDISSQEYEKRMLLEMEKEVLGEYVTGSHDSLYVNFFETDHQYSQNIAIIEKMPDKSQIKLEGVLTKFSSFVSKKQNIIGQAILENCAGESINVTIWHDMYKELTEISSGKDLPVKAVFEVSTFKGKALLLKKVDHIYKGELL